jgi:hypothetical protein
MSIKYKEPRLIDTQVSVWWDSVGALEAACLRREGSGRCGTHPSAAGSAAVPWPAGLARLAQDPMQGSEDWEASAQRTGPRGHTPHSPPPVTRTPPHTYTVIPKKSSESLHVCGCMCVRASECQQWIWSETLAPLWWNTAPHWCTASLRCRGEHRLWRQMDLSSKPNLASYLASRPLLSLSGPQFPQLYSGSSFMPSV